MEDGSTKTSKNALKVIYHCIAEKECSAMVLRRYSNSLRNSVYKEIKKALRRLGLTEDTHYKASLSPMCIVLYNGNSIYFTGGDDYEKIKGFIDETRPIKIVWFEELTEFECEEDLQQIIATFSRGNNDWFISLYTYNPPKNKYDWVNQWVEKMAKRPDVLITQTDYRTVDKNWLGKMFIDEAERLKQYDEKRYNWIYLGEVIGIEGLIFNIDLIQRTKEIPRINYIDIAVDSGHQTSATIFLAIGSDIKGNKYLLDTYYYSPKEKAVKKAPSELAKDYILFKNHCIRTYKAQIDTEVIDCAERSIKKSSF